MLVYNTQLLLCILFLNKICTFVLKYKINSSFVMKFCFIILIRMMNFVTKVLKKLFAQINFLCIKAVHIK